MQDWKQIYKERLMSADEAVKFVQSGERWATTHATAESWVLTEALCKRAMELENVQLWQGLNWGTAQYCEPQYHGHLDVDTIFCGTATRQAVNEKRGNYGPMHVSMIDRAFETTVPIDGLLAHVTPPDENGYCNLGVSVDFGASAIAHGKKIIAQVNPSMPWVFGQHNTIHVSQILAFVEENTPLLNIPPIDDTDPLSTKIGENIAELIEDGSCLQMGQGGVPNAILKFLGDKKDLGVHTEVFTDNLIPLIKAGVVNGKRKNINKGKIVATFVQGTKALYRYVDHNNLIELKPVDYTNDVRVIAQIDNFISINNAIDCDLFGQVNAESAGIKHISGTGGQLDFAMGAYLSKGGKSFICMSSTVTGKDGTVKSRIVPTLTPGSICTDPRSCTHYIVTEYGMVNLKGLSTWQRAEALIGIAHPDFREQLIADAEKMHIWRRSNK